jgi:hypothetical protein
MSGKLFPVFLLVAFAFGIGSARAADQIFCSCHFEAGASYSAVGTRAACSTFTKEKACTVAFGGIGAQPNAVSRLGIDPGKFRESAFRLLFQNLEAVRNNSLEPISNREFLQEAIVTYLRAAYLRQGLEISDETLRDLDKQVQDFSGEYASQISGVFLSRNEPFRVNWRDNSTLEVQRGAIRFVYKNSITLVASFF